MPETSTEPPAKPRAPWWRRKRLWLPLTLLAALLWLDGPGWRWLATKAAGHYLPPLGIDATFQLDGRLSSGEIHLNQVTIGGSSFIRRAALDSATVRFRPLRVIHGEIESLALSRLHADVDLDLLPPSQPPDPGETPPPIAEILRQIQQRLAPVALDLRQVSTTLRRGNDVLFEIETTDLIHPAGSQCFELHLGQAEIAATHRLDPQTTILTWDADEVALDRLEILPELAVTDLTAGFPGSAPIDLRGTLAIFDSSLAFKTDLLSISASLSGPPLPLPPLLGKLDTKLPIQGSITRFDADLRQLENGLASLTGTARLGLADFQWDGWHTADALLEIDLSTSRISTRLSGTGLGSPVDLRIAGEILRQPHFRPGRLEGSLDIAEIREPLEYVRQRFLDPDTGPPIPSGKWESKLKADFTRSWNPPSSATISIVSPTAAPPLNLAASWDGQGLAVAEFSTPSLDLQGTFETPTLHYTGAIRGRDFHPSSLAPWLAPFGIATPQDLTGSFAWSGSGSLKNKTHNGQLKLTDFSLLRDPAAAPVTAVASVRYDWPSSATIESLELRHATQTLRTRATLAGQRLAIEEIHWQDGDLPILQGKASIPVPADLSNWKAILRSADPIDATISGQDLPLARLHPFLPPNIRFLPTSRGHVSIVLSGTPLDPTLDATIRGHDLSLSGHDAIPPIRIDLQATGRGKSLKVEGDVTAPDYPPAVIDALTVWDPRQWAEDPETVRQAALDASVVIENLQIGMFSRFVPQARKLAGEINLRGQVTGTIGEPLPALTLSVDQAAFETPDPSVPRLKDGTLKLTASPASIRLETLSGMLSGGLFKATGSAEIRDGSIGKLELDLDGDALPIARNDSVVVRASSKLKVRGTLDDARIDGSITMVDSVFYRDFEILPIGTPMDQVAEPKLPSVDSDSPAEMLSKIPAPFRDWKLDLALKTENPFLIRGNLGNGEIYLDARLAGTLGSPRPTGHATLREITAQLPFSTLEIPTGRITLRPDAPFDPALEIRGGSKIRPYEVDLYIYGSLSDPRIQTTSNPPLPESEVLTLLATGATSEGVEDTSAASARAAQLLIEEIRRGRIEIVSGLRPLFSVLDKVEFQVGERDPYSNKKFNSASFELSDEWLLTAGFSEEGRTRAKVTYLIRFR